MSYAEHSQPREDYQAGAERGGINPPVAHPRGNQQLVQRPPAPPQDPESALKRALWNEREKFRALLPKGMRPEGFFSLVMRETRRWPAVADVQLHQVDFGSLIDAAHRSAQLGIQIGDRGHLIPYRDKHSDKYQVRFAPSYQGLEEAIRRSWDAITALSSDVICTNDEFRMVRGSSPKIEHIPAPLDKPRGEIIGAYAIVWFREGDPNWQAEVINKDELAKIQRCAKQQYIWRSWPEEMAKKSAINRLSKHLPLSPQAAALVAVEYEGSDPSKANATTVRLDKPAENGLVVEAKGPSGAPSPPTQEAKGNEYDDVFGSPQ